MDTAGIGALIERQIRAWSNADLDAIVADFANDGMFIAPSGRWQGHAGIRAAAEAFFRTAHQVRILLHSIIFDGERGALEWTWNELRQADGRRYAADDAIVFTIRDDKIAYWREYFNTAELSRPVSDE